VIAPPAPVAAFVAFAVRAAARMRAIGLARTAASLSYTTLLALVPLATVALTFVARFPVFQAWLDALETFLLRYMLPGSAYTVVHDYLRAFTDNATGLTGISIMVIVATAAMATATIEREINLIWGITRRRPLGRRIVVYALGLTVGPVLVGASLSLTTWAVTQSLGGFAGERVLLPMPLAFTTAALTLLYAVVPAQRVPWRHAALGALAAALAFEAAKHGFAYYLTRVPTYELVYGALAALPVFLIWIYVCWLIVLAGAAITATLSDPAPLPRRASRRKRARRRRPRPGSRPGPQPGPQPGP
jgi:membrane protein